MKVKVLKIISSAQPGVCRAALDWALKNRILIGGWSSKRTMDKEIAQRYNLEVAANNLQRTEFNVRDSDGTLIISISTTLTGGPAGAANFAEKLRKPILHVHRGNIVNARELFRAFLNRYDLKVLNVVGPRGSKNSEDALLAEGLLDDVLKGE